MFKFAAKRQVRWPVTIKVPQDGGGVEHVTVSILFELLTRSEYRALEGADAEHIETTLRGKIKGWQDVADVDGNLIDFTPEALAEFLDAPYVERAVSIALMQASAGAAAAKN